MTIETKYNIGEEEWRGCGAMKNAITHWQEIVLPKKLEV